MPRASRSRRGSTSKKKEEDDADSDCGVLGGSGSSSPTPQQSSSTAQETADTHGNDDDKPSEESLVLSYLRRHGLSDAASELQTILEKEASTNKGGSDGKKRKRSDTDEGGLPPIDYDVSGKAGGCENASAYKSGSVLKSATGGGFGYDLDAAPSIALWGAGSAPPVMRNRKISELLLEGRERDGVEDGSTVKNEEETDGDVAMEDANKADAKKKDQEEEIEAMVNFRDETRRYIEGFTSLVTWILTLPDDPANPIASPMTCGRPPFSGRKKKDSAGDMDEESHIPHSGLVNLVKHSLAAMEHFDPSEPKPPAPHTLTLPLGAIAAIPSESSIQHDPLLMPPSCKPELLALSFPILVHTYCELLTCGLEHTAVALLDTYRHLYESNHPNEFADLDKCQTTKSIVEVNDNVLAQVATNSELRLYNSQIRLIAHKLSEIESPLKELKSKSKRTAEEEKLHEDYIKRVERYKDTYEQSRDKFRELSSKNDNIKKKFQALPFLHKSRALKWNITISTASFGALSGFVSQRDELLPMSALLQSRCHLIVERRDPLPFCPPAVLEDVDGSVKKDVKVRWAAPLHPGKFFRQ